MSNFNFQKHEYFEKFQSSLEQFGLSEVDSKEISQFRNKGDTYYFKRFFNSTIDILISQGCINFSNHNSMYRDEYLINAEHKDAMILLDMVCYYHTTNRSLDFTEVIPVGDNCPSTDFLFISVPFFLPNHINNTNIAEIKCQLKWLMPINDFEAKFIKKYGPDIFEERLFSSNYDFFDERTNLDYLEIG